SRRRAALGPDPGRSPPGRRWRRSWAATPRPPRSKRSCHHVADARQPQGSLRFAAAGVVARVAVDRLIGVKIAPVKVGREIGTPFHAARRIDVNRTNARAARLAHLAP